MRKEKTFATRRNGASVLREAAQLICAVMASLWFVQCNDDFVDRVPTAKNELRITATTSLTKAGTGVIRGQYLPDGATLGVSLRPTAGGLNYDNTEYTNYLYTASGTESEQTWAAETGKPILLSATEATAYAYFPRQAGVTDITKVPISNDTETDYMYAAPAENISIANKTASFQMSHVMSVIRVSVVKGNYTGTGSLESLQVKGNTAATSAKLNVIDGTLSEINGAGTPISKSGSWTFATIGTQDLWAVPAATSSPLQFTVGVDGNNMLATSEPLQLLPGKIYTYTLTINSNEIKISKVTVNDWDIIPKDNLTPEPALTWATAPDGVYAVSADVTPVLLADADASCIGVAIVNRATNQCLMIEKYGEKNESYKEAHIAYGGDNVTEAENDPENAEGYYSCFAWGGDKIVYENISSASSIDGSAEKIQQGTFDQEGEYYISSDPATWTNGALADFNGKQNKPYLSTVLSNNNDEGLNYTPIAYAMNYYNESDDNQGFDDWFVPSLGQLSLIWVNLTSIDQALEKIGGTLLMYERPLFGTSALYWSSTQLNEIYSNVAGRYAVVCGEGLKHVTLAPHFYTALLRLVRDLSGDNTRHLPETAGSSITSNEHTINLTGDKSGISISQKTAADGTVTLYVSADDPSSMVNPISVSEGCTVKQINDYNNNRIKLTMSALTTDIDVTFSGVSSKADALTIDGTPSGISVDKDLDASGLFIVTLSPTQSDTYITTGGSVSGGAQIISEDYQADGSLMVKLKSLSPATLTLNDVHTVSYKGDKTGITISQQRAIDGSFKINVTANKSDVINQITVSSGCTVNQNNDYENNCIEITLTDITADNDVTYSGVLSKVDAVSIDGTTAGMTIDKTVDAAALLVVTLTPTTSDTYINKGCSVSGDAQIISEERQEDGSLVLKLKVHGLATLSLNGVADFVTASTAVDGVYFVWPGEKLATEGESFCTGVALINSATNQKFMIEKYENQNNTESANVYKTAAQQLGSTDRYLFSWGGEGSTSGTFVSTNVGDGSTNEYGYLPKPDGGYANTPNLNGSPSVWITTTGALSDFAGNSNSQIIKNILDNGTETSSKTAPMAYLMNAFNDPNCSKTVNQGYKDWYIPSCGQLGLIWLNKTELDNALTAIGGTIFARDCYWSSSEISSNGGWGVYLDYGCVQRIGKYFGHRVRLVRNLN